LAHVPGDHTDAVGRYPGTLPRAHGRARTLMLGECRDDGFFLELLLHRRHELGAQNACLVCAGVTRCGLLELTNERSLFRDRR
jgi:hypothetical protein